MQYFGKILGVIIGLLSGIGFWGVAIGILIGYIADKFTNVQTSKHNFNKKKYQRIFFNITFEIMGHLTKSKGRVTNEDIKMASLFMDEMKLNEEECILAKKSFQIGKKNNYPLREKLKELKNISFFKSNLIKNFLEIQIKMAFYDGFLHPNEANILYIIAEELGISHNSFSYFLSAMQNNKNHFYKNNQKDFWKYDQSFEYENYKNQGFTTLEEACNILGVNINDDKFIIKRAYKKLMSQYHPDKLIAKGLPLKILEEAKIKTQKIRLAYDFIKQKKRFK